MILGVGALLFFVKYAAAVQEKQLTELTAIYPELESVLAENFEFYGALLVKGICFLGIVLGIIIVTCVGSLYWFSEKVRRQEQSAVKKETEIIMEQLVKFRKGDFEWLPVYTEAEPTDTVRAKSKRAEEERDETEYAEAWCRIQELLRELGFYFADLKERLAEEENSTKALITDISHQLKTPLASIRMSHELVKSETLTVEERQEFLKSETQEINKLELLLEELVNISRLESNMIQLKPEYQSMKQTITEAVSQVYMKAHNKQMEICVEFEADILVKHDIKWTVEALVNVLDNAIKYSEAGTTIQIRVERLSTYLLIEIEDEGMGITEEELHKIFKRFYRGEGARKCVKDGAGVGLYLARWIVEQQGGTILAKRKFGKGSIFKITLPL